MHQPDPTIRRARLFRLLAHQHAAERVHAATRWRPGLNLGTAMLLQDRALASFRPQKLPQMPRR
ncbi:hypothetical protein ACFORG_22055 [Lutimaribacter marinistellae]|uniref:Uncharacterized protein n=1 Tax=Lutimaribacter marinistellae TaxID=1820329 RepID=A0ABV7TN35_9RHOB